MKIVQVVLPDGTVWEYEFDTLPTHAEISKAMEHVGGRPKR